MINVALRKRKAWANLMLSITLCLAAIAAGWTSIDIVPAFGQTTPELKKLNPQFVTEPGCPVEVVAVRTELEVDPFGTPLAARHYIDYRNVGNRPISAVKFRIGYVDDQGSIRGTFHAADGHPLNPGQQASQKWRGDKIDPRTMAVKMRVLVVKYSDGTTWESVKMRVLVTPQSQSQSQGFAPMVPESQDTGDGSGSAPPPMPPPLASPVRGGNAGLSGGNAGLNGSGFGSSAAGTGAAAAAGSGGLTCPAPAAPENPVAETAAYARKPPAKRAAKPEAPPPLPSDPAAAFDTILNMTGGASRSARPAALDLAPAPEVPKSGEAKTPPQPPSSANPAGADFDALLNGGTSTPAAGSAPSKPASKGSTGQP